MTQSLKLMEINLIEKLSNERLGTEDHSFEFQAAIGYVISIRDNGDAKKVGFAAHQQAFEEYMWNTTVDELNEAAEKAGLSESDDEEVKKD